MAYTIVVYKKSQHMKNSKRTHDPIQQNKGNVKPSLKHDANLQKNATLYFQIGLIVCLLAAFGLLEMQFEHNIPKYAAQEDIPIENVELALGEVKIYKPVVKQSKPTPKLKPKAFVNTVKIIEDSDTTIESIIDLPLTDDFIDIEHPNIPDLEKPEAVDPVVEFVHIEQVPLYPGCEKKTNNAAKKKCMSDKITKLVQRKFEGTAIANTYGLKGKQNIYVQFQIDKTGKVSDIKTRASHPKLEEEAKRVVKEIPVMKPGRQRDKPVSVRYTLPIAFSIQ